MNSSPKISAVLIFLLIAGVGPVWSAPAAAVFEVAEADAAVDAGEASDSNAVMQTAPTAVDWGDYTPSQGSSAGNSGDSVGGGLRQSSSSAGYDTSGGGVASSGRAGSGKTLLTSPTRGGAFRAGELLRIFPSATLGLGYNDNVLSSNTNERSSLFYQLKPVLVGEIYNRGDRMTLSYQGNYLRYADLSSEKIDHHELWAAYDKVFTSRFRVGGGVGFISSVDPRESSDGAALSGEPSQWHAPVARLLAVYGAEGAKGRIEVEGKVLNKRYDNNRAATEALDVDSASLAGRFFYRFQTRTYVFVEASETVNDYKLSTSTLDNHDHRVYVGATWDATAKTTGRFKLGRAFKQFDHPAQNDLTVNTYEGSVRWSPRSYSHFDLSMKKVPGEALGTANFIESKSAQLGWTHHWKTFISSTVYLGQNNDRYFTSSRRDDVNYYGVGFYRALGNNLRFGVDARQTERSSNEPGREFNRNTVMLTLEGVL